MSDWEDDVQMDTENQFSTRNGNDSFKTNNERNNFDRTQRRQNNDDQLNNGSYRNSNNSGNNYSNNTGASDGFRRNQNNNFGGYKRDNSQGGDFQGRRNRENNDSQNNDTENRFNRRRDNSQGGGFQGRRNRENNDSQNNDTENRFNRRRDNSQGGGFQGRRNRENNDSQNNDAENRFNRRRDNSQGGGFQGRRSNQDDSNDQGATFSRRRNQNNSEQDNDFDNQTERRRGRQNNNYDNQETSNDNDRQQIGERRRNNRDSNENDNAESSTLKEGEKKSENYIPRRYNKEDDDLFEMISEGINFNKFENIPVQLSGENIPEPLQRFSDIAKHESIIEAIKKSGYKTLTPIQKYGIPAIMANRDLMASAQTGSGKTMTFLLPIIQNLVDDPSSKEYGDKCSPQCLIITPVRELAIQIFEQALKLTYKNDLKPCLVYGGTASSDQRNRLVYGANIVVATMGRLIDYLDKEIISLSKVKFFVIDEADRMIDQGFSPCVRRVVNEFDLPENRQTLMFSATFPETVQELAQEFLKNDYIFCTVGILGAANEDVTQEMRHVTFKNKKAELYKILEEIYNENERILIFCERKKQADFLAANLCDNDRKATSIHGDRYQSQREQALCTFKKGQTPILVATAVAARGLDIKGVGYVINYDLPKTIEEYIHRIGRTGRVGNYGKAISFFDPKDDSEIGSSLVKVLTEAGQEVPDFLKSYDDGTSFINVTAEKDQRDKQTENLAKKTETYQATVVEEEDW